ncbi:MAG: DUF721 domain-containing protein [Nitrospira sp.]|nr:DUF721 domain-containing protein [Nitrospira sp.]
MPRTGSLDSCGAILSGLSKRLGLETKLLEFRLQRQWRDIVGEPLASQTWPAHIRFKKLYLIVRNSVWLQQLTFLKPSLLDQVGRAVGMEPIKDIVFRVGEIPVPAVPSENDPVVSGRPPERDEVETAPLALGIRDPELRRRFTEAIARYPFRQARSRPAKDP